MISVEGARQVAGGIPDAVLVELDGDDHFPWLGDTDPLTAEIETFLDELVRPPSRSPAAARR